MSDHVFVSCLASTLIFISVSDGLNGKVVHVAKTIADSNTIFLSNVVHHETQYFSSIF